MPGVDQPRVVVGVVVFVNLNGFLDCPPGLFVAVGRLQRHAQVKVRRGQFPAAPGEFVQERVPLGLADCFFPRLLVGVLRLVHFHGALEVRQRVLGLAEADERDAEGFQAARQLEVRVILAVGLRFLGVIVGRALRGHDALDVRDAFFGFAEAQAHHSELLEEIMVVGVGVHFPHVVRKRLVPDLAVPDQPVPQGFRPQQGPDRLPGLAELLVDRAQKRPRDRQLHTRAAVFQVDFHLEHPVCRLVDERWQLDKLPPGVEPFDLPDPL